jgi:hypothetical protein
MPRNETDHTQPEDWKKITAHSTSAITFQNQGPRHVLIKGTETDDKPEDSEAAIRFEQWEGVTDTPLTSLWPGIEAHHVWIWCSYTQPYMVSHA